MRPSLLGLLFALAFLFSTTIHAQQSATATPTRDPQALAVLNQCLATAGGAQALTTVQDFTETGNITYFWAGEQPTGRVTVRGMGLNDFRVDADMTDGTRSWVVSGWSGATRDAAGKISRIAVYNALRLGSESFPQQRLLAVLNDPSFSISPINANPLNGQQAERIRVQKNYSTADDPTGEMSKWSITDFFIDPKTSLLVEVQDSLRPNDSPRGAYLHETIFANYKNVNGVLMPLTVTEKAGGQQTWTMQLSSVEFNTGLTDAEFHF